MTSKALDNVIKLRNIVSVKDFGAVADGVTDNAQAFAAALASLAPNGGALYIPAGDYVIWRGVGGFTPVISGVSTDNIICDNVMIYGDGNATRIFMKNYLGQIPDSSGNEFYNPFQAQDRSNIVIRDMYFEGYGTPVSLWRCTNVKVQNITVQGQLTQNVTNVLSITNITQANPGVVTYTGNDPVNGDLYTITGVSGMTQINDKPVRVSNVNTTAKTFQLRISDNSTTFDTSGYSAYTSGGTAAKATNWCANKAVHLNGCVDVLVEGCTFLNNEFAVYLGGIGGAASTTSRCIVSNCMFKQTTPAGQFTALFPCGVYWVYTKDCVVDSCTFVDFFSSVANGTTGDGQGYGIYEGDGASTSGVISNNTFMLRSKSNLTACAIYLNEMQACTVTGNTFETEANTSTQGALVLIDSKNQNSRIVVTGNTIRRAANAAASSITISFFPPTSANAPDVKISDNVIVGGFNNIRIDGGGNGKYNISNNTLRESTNAAFQVMGVSQATGFSVTIPHKNLLIQSNRIEKSGRNGILINGVCLQTQILNNTILDGNTTNQAGDLGAAIWFTDNSFGSTIVGNTIGNTPHGGGLFTLGVTNSNNAADRIFKDITANNTFYSFSDGSQINSNRFFSSSPTNGLYDLQRGDFIQNQFFASGGVPGWYVTSTTNQALSVNASSASTTVTVPSTGSILAGDIVLLVKKANMYDSAYYTTTEWHADTVASVTNGTEFVLTTGIPAGDGTYVAGTAQVITARFKAAAAVAA
jgi:hypothetical protein